MSHEEDWLRATQDPADRMEDWQIEELLSRLEAKYEPLLIAYRKGLEDRAQFDRDIEWLQVSTIPGKPLDEEWYQALFRTLKYAIENIPKSVG